MTFAVQAPHQAPLEVVSDLPADTWNAYVEAQPQATVYHLAQWAGVIQRAFGRRATMLATREHGRVTGVLPLVFFDARLFGRFVTSMPFVNYGGIVADTAAATGALFAAAVADARSRRAAYLELRHANRLLPDAPVRDHKVAMVLPLASSADAQWSALDRKIRNQVRKAEKSNLIVREGGVELLEAFYTVLCRNMRDLGSPVHARRFFEQVLTTFPDRTRIVSVWLGSTPVAASLVLWHRQRMEVPWASAIRDYNALCPNMLLYWAMLKMGIGRGFTEFDFGRSTPHEGTYQFKEQWGALPHQLWWEYWLDAGVTLPDRSPKNSKFSLGIAAWRRLPVAVANTLGPLIVRNIP